MDTMEKKLGQLFDYQHFEDNDQLRSVINSVSARYSVRELDMDELEWVSAAGTPDLQSPAANLFRRMKPE